MTYYVSRYDVLYIFIRASYIIQLLSIKNSISLFRPNALVVMKWVRIYYAVFTLSKYDKIFKIWFSVDNHGLLMAAQHGYYIHSLSNLSKMHFQKFENLASFI